MVHTDLDATESILQSLDALAHLNKVTADVFDKILAKVYFYSFSSDTTSFFLLVFLNFNGG